jgi:hypothetical protein
MKRALWLLTFLVWTPLAQALSPYVQGNTLPGADVERLRQEVASKLRAVGLSVIGSYSPKGLDQYGVVVATDDAILNAIRSLGGASIVGAGIRVGVKSDGTVSYMNPDYWYRAYFGKNFTRYRSAVKDADDRLRKALGAKGTLGGDVPASTLADYRYMFGLESFDQPSLLKSYPSFDAAVATIQKNLARGEKQTSKVYEVVMPDKQLAVFGVAMANRSTGEAAWVSKLVPDQIAALPYEIYVVDNKAYALHPRFRIALSWPALTMGTFLKIGNTPTEILATLTPIAGGVFRAAGGFGEEGWF